MVTKYFSPSPSLTSFPVKPFFCFTGPRAINMPVGAKHQRLFSQPSGTAISLTGAHLSTHARARSYPAKHSARLALASGYACLSFPKFVAPLQGNHELHLLILRSFRFSCFHCPFRTATAALCLILLWRLGGAFGMRIKARAYVWKRIGEER